MIKALSMSPWLNTKDEERRLEAAKVCLATKNPRYKQPKIPGDMQMNEQIGKELDGLVDKADNTEESLELSMEKLMLIWDYIVELKVVEEDI